MPTSQSTPSPTTFFILSCLAIMAFTAVKIWDQPTQTAIGVRQTADWVGPNGAVQVVETQATEGKSGSEVPRPRKFGAEIRAEVALANSLAAIEPAVEPFELPLPIEESPWVPDPVSIEVPMQLAAPSAGEFNLDRAKQTLETRPAMQLPPMQPEAEFAADVATPPLDRVATRLERTEPIVAPPSAIAAPRSPATIVAMPVPQPVNLAPVNPVQPAPATSTAPNRIAANEVAAEQAEVADTLSLPLPPIRPVVPDEPVTTDLAEVNVANPELPPPAPRAFEPLSARDIVFDRSPYGAEKPIAPSPSSLLPAPAAPTPAPTPVITVDPVIPEPVVSAEPVVNAEPIVRAETPDAVAEDEADGDQVRDAIQAARKAAEAKRNTEMVDNQPARRQSAWPPMVALKKDLADLQALKTQAGTEGIVEWANAIDATLEALRATDGLNTVDTQQPLAKLRYFVDQTPQVNHSGIQARINVAQYAVQRRLAVWDTMQLSMDPDVTTRIDRVHSNPDNAAIVQLTRQLRRGLGEGAAAENWNRFLMLDSVERLALSGHSSEAVQRVDVAARLLERMNREQLSPVQRSLMQSEVARQLQTKLRTWSTANINYRHWLTAIERIEANPTFRETDDLVDMATQLKWSWSEAQNQLAATFFSHYRNANARLAVTELLLNRMLPIIRDSQTPVRQEILGARVFGNSASWTKIGLDLLPDNQRLKMKLVANGNVNMQTRTVKGPAVVFNRNQSQFYLQKMIMCDQQGVHIGKSTTTASTKLKVLDLRTKFDGVPLIGSIARRKVQQQVNEQRNLAKRVIDRRVASEAQTKVDSQLTQQLFDAQQRIEEKLIQPLRQLQLDPTTMSLKTTHNRMVYEGRLAAEHHLAAFTPRPYALANSVISLQLHESAINNAIERMHIDGRRGDLREMLEAAVASRPKANFQIPDDVPTGVTLQLADQDAIRMRWNDGSMRITIRVAEIAFKRRSWKNFTVSANYRPKVAGLDAELYRDGVVELVGQKRLSMRDQVALRGIFGKVFSKNRNIPVIPANLAKDRRLADLQVNQFMIRDGWVGVSVGRQPQNVARQRGKQNYRR